MAVVLGLSPIFHHKVLSYVATLITKNIVFIHSASE